MQFLYREYSIGDATREPLTQQFSVPRGTGSFRIRQFVIDLLESDDKHILYRISEDGLS
jgi:hypothetical protein